MPECLRASVYIPPGFISQHPDSHPAIAHLVQHFIEHFVTRTVSRWTDLARRRWSLDQPGRGTHNPPDPPLVPQPKSCRHAKYLFFGRPVGSLEHLPLPPAFPARPLAVIDISDLDESDDQDLGTHGLRSKAMASRLTAHNRPHGASSKHSMYLATPCLLNRCSSSNPFTDSGATLHVIYLQFASAWPLTSTYFSASALLTHRSFTCAHCTRS